MMEDNDRIENFITDNILDDCDVITNILGINSLKPWQRKLIEVFFNERFIVVNKTQHVNSKSFISKLAFSLFVKEENFKILILVDSLKSLRTFYDLIFETFRTYNYNMNYFNSYGIDYHDKNFILEIKNKDSNDTNEIEVTVDPKKCLNKNYDLLIIDDAAYIEDIKNKYDYLVPNHMNYNNIFKPYGIIICSEMNNFSDDLRKGVMGNWFSSCWNDAINFCNDFIPIYVAKDNDKEIENEDYFLFREDDYLD